MRVGAKKLSRNDKNDGRKLVHHDKDSLLKANGNESFISSSTTTIKKRKTPLLFHKSSPVDIRQIDSSFSFQTLVEQQDDDEDDGGEIVDHHVEQTILAITSFEVSGCNHVDFKDEEEATEYSGAAQLVSSDALPPSYAQFVPGLSFENSCDATNTSIAAVEQPTTVLHEKDEDIEVQAPTPLVQSDDVIVAKIRQELLEEEQVVPTSGSSPQQQQSNRANDHKPSPWKRNRCLLMTSLVLFLIGISLTTGFTMRSRRRQDTYEDSPVITNRTTGSCSFCADATIPPNLNMIYITETQTCMDFSNNQVLLDANDIQCTKGQALAWMFCNCPTLPTTIPP
jgi:hypothetical protein